MGLGAVYGIGNYIQAAYTYQIANSLPPRIQEGSFWLTMNPEPFLYPGVALTIIGLAMVIHEGVTSVNSYNKQQAEAAKQ
jgi:hypothetical protein